MSSSLVNHLVQKTGKATSKRVDYRKAVLALLSPLQREFIEDKSRFKLARCGRRAGKSHMDAAYLILVALEHENGVGVYFGLTKDSAKEALWDPLTAILNDVDIPHEASEHKLEITFPNGSRIRLIGADMDNIKKRLRGRKHRIVIIDETEFFSSGSVDAFVTEVLLPTTADFAAPMVMTSSPGPLPKGLFWEGDQGKNQGKWLTRHWTLRDNPFFQGPALDPVKYKNRADEELQTIVDFKFNGDWNDPTFRREYLGEWVFDDRSLVYPFSAPIPKEYPFKRAQYAVGFNMDKSGMYGAVVLKFSEYTRTVQVVETQKGPVKTLNEFARKIERILDDYGSDTGYVFLGDKDPELLTEFRTKYQQVAALQVNQYKKDSFYQALIAADMDHDLIECTPDAKDLIEEFQFIVKDGSGDEIADQETLLADAFFAVYSNVYQTVIKHQEEELSHDERIERDLLEKVQAEFIENRDYYRDLY